MHHPAMYQPSGTPEPSPAEVSASGPPADLGFQTCWLAESMFVYLSIYLSLSFSLSLSLSLCVCLPLCACACVGVWVCGLRVLLCQAATQRLDVCLNPRLCLVATGILCLSQPWCTSCVCGGGPRCKQTKQPSQRAMTLYQSSTPVPDLKMSSNFQHFLGFYT